MIHTHLLVGLIQFIIKMYFQLTSQNTTNDSQNSDIVTFYIKYER
jgi:hypothetical protein